MKTNDCIRVLCINYVSDPYGGVPVFLMNVFHYINHEKFKLDFLTPNESSYKPFKPEIREADGKIYALHVNANSPLGKLRYGKRLYIFLKHHPYDIVHINSGSISFDCVSAIIAKSYGAKVIIHTHCTGGRSWWKETIAFLLKIIMQREADVLCACSKAAAKSTFTYQEVNKDDIVIVKNGIDLQRFRYNKETRDRIRKELNLEDRLVIGHVGRFVEQKNHEFLIDIFVEILCKEPTAILLLVGQGELENVIREKVQNLHIEDNVIFYGGREDVENFYQAMDVFLFPSIYEGLPIALIEAQANGLPCVISDTVTPEVDLTSLIHRVSLKDSYQVWANKVLSVKSNDDKRDSYEAKLKEAGYSIEDTVLQISRIYEELI